MDSELNNQSPPPHDWVVLVLGGASGTGKTSLSYRLAHHFGVGLTELDDLHIAVEKMTTAAQQPALHYWNTHPEAMKLPPEAIFELLLNDCRALAPAVQGVIENHLEGNVPVILEGDYALPELLAGYDQRVRGLFVFEPDAEQLAKNYLAREPQAGPQIGRARVSWLYGNWLQMQCQELSLPVLPARPWATVLERAIALVGAADV